MKKDFLKSNKIGIFILSRYNSKRLKKKAGLKILGKTITEILIQRLSNFFDKKNLTICSSKTNNNIKFYKLVSKKFNIKVFFGNEKNVLKRIIDCMKLNRIKHFVRVTGDNPLTDPSAILNLANLHIKRGNDYTYTESLPIGLRPEIFSLKALEKNYKFIEDLNSTEYLTYFFIRKNLYKIQKVNLIKKFKNQHKLSISIDTKKDFLLLKKMVEYYRNIFIKKNEIILYLKKNSNQKIVKKKIFLKTKKYNVKYSFDNKKYIFLR